MIMCVCMCSSRDEQTQAFLQHQIWRSRSKVNSQIAVPLGDISLPCPPIIEEELSSSSTDDATVVDCIPRLFKPDRAPIAVATRAPIARPVVQLQTREQIIETKDPVRVCIDGAWCDATVAEDQSGSFGKLWVWRSGEREAVSWHSMRPADAQTSNGRLSKKERWQLLLCCLDKRYQDKRSWSPFRTMQVGQAEDRRQCLADYDQVIDCLSNELPS